MKKIVAFILLIITFSCEKDDSMSPAEDLDIVAEFRENLSELNIFKGNLSNLNINSKVFEYQLITPLFTDYTHKLRLIALPENTQMQYNGNGTPIFPNNTVISKTFYYNLNEQNPALGRKIIETRVLIKRNGIWETGNYKWNEDQTDAILHPDGSEVPVTWTNEDGVTVSTNYKIPANNQCFACHSSYDEITPLGVRLDLLNFSPNGINQIEELTANQRITDVDFDNLISFPRWDDVNNYTLEERARAYLDVNCAHCHSDGGYCAFPSSLRLNYDIPLEETNIIERKGFIIFRTSSDYQEGLTMPWIGTSMLHDEGVSLMLEYLDTL
ncbi:hypothetical protein [Winogradskyella sp.]|uniref:hypothetical protein n=1 Tax=Winogradskyella sp. TaxID=1883156 RepID=UPI0025DE0748|nr:hypothetical protein [Winogradskyella sp.]